jgi:sugar lactone lactonase YvrE
MPTAVIVTTLAGVAGVTGSADGQGPAASFNLPSGIDCDNGVDMFVSDTRNQTIRKITPGGLVTTLAGLTGVAGSADGTGNAARFSFPGGLWADKSGVVFVADSGNNTIRQITAGGVVTTLAGLAGNVGFADGTGAAARFHAPNDIVGDNQGNLYVADTLNSTIRKVTYAGVVTTLAGLATFTGSTDGLGNVARFKQPYGIGIEASGNICVGDTENYTVRRVTPAGLVTTVAGTPLNYGSADGVGAAASFSETTGVEGDALGNIWVADQDNCTVRKITPAGVVTTVAGAVGIVGSADGPGLAARFNTLSALAFDSAGNMYIADQGNNTIRKLTMFSTDPASLAKLGACYGSCLTPRMLDWVLISLLCKWANTP